jgi:hypothetical protein
MFRKYAQSWEDLLQARQTAQRPLPGNLARSIPLPSFKLTYCENQFLPDYQRRMFLVSFTRARRLAITVGCPGISLARRPVPRGKPDSRTNLCSYAAFKKCDRLPVLIGTIIHLYLRNTVEQRCLASNYSSAESLWRIGLLRHTPTYTAL